MKKRILSSIVIFTMLTMMIGCSKETSHNNNETIEVSNNETIVEDISTTPYEIKELNGKDYGDFVIIKESTNDAQKCLNARDFIMGYNADVTFVKDTPIYSYGMNEIGYLKKNIKVTVLDYNLDWVRIKFDEKNFFLLKMDDFNSSISNEDKKITDEDIAKVQVVLDMMEKNEKSTQEEVNDNSSSQIVDTESKEPNNGNSSNKDSSTSKENTNNQGSNQSSNQENNSSTNNKQNVPEIPVEQLSKPSITAEQAKANAESLLRQYGLVTFVEDTQKAWDNGEYETSGWTYEEVMALAKNYKAAGYFVGYVTSDGNANDILNAYVGFGYIAYYLEYVGPGPDNGANAYKFKCYYY